VGEPIHTLEAGCAHVVQPGLRVTTLDPLILLSDEFGCMSGVNSLEHPVAVHGDIPHQSKGAARSENGQGFGVPGLTVHPMPCLGGEHQVHGVGLALPVLERGDDNADTRQVLGLENPGHLG
jgi:hypothetical protein